MLDYNKKIWFDPMKWFQTILESNQAIARSSPLLFPNRFQVLPPYLSGYHNQIPNTNVDSPWKMYHSNHLLGNDLPKYPVCLFVLSQESLYSFANDESRRAQAIKKQDHNIHCILFVKLFQKLKRLKGKLMDILDYLSIMFWLKMFSFLTYTHTI